MNQLMFDVHTVPKAHQRDSIHSIIYTMTPHTKHQLIQQIQLIEANLTQSKQTIRTFENLLFEYSQLANQEVSSVLIVDMTERMVAERNQYETTTSQYEELLSKLGRL